MTLIECSKATCQIATGLCKHINCNAGRQTCAATVEIYLTFNGLRLAIFIHDLRRRRSELIRTTCKIFPHNSRECSHNVGTQVQELLLGFREALTLTLTNGRHMA